MNNKKKNPNKIAVQKKMSRIAIFFMILTFVFISNCDKCCIDCPIENLAACPSNQNKIRVGQFICVDPNTTMTIHGEEPSFDFDNISVFTVCKDINVGPIPSSTTGNSDLILLPINETNTETGGDLIAFPINETEIQSRQTDCSYCITNNEIKCPVDITQAVSCYCNISLIPLKRTPFDINGIKYDNSKICTKRYAYTALEPQLPLNPDINEDFKSSVVFKLPSNPYDEINELMEGTQSVTIQMGNRNATIFYTGFTHPYVYISKEYLGNYYNLTQNPQTVPLLERFYETNGDVIFTMFNNGTIVYTESNFVARDRPKDTKWKYLDEFWYYMTSEKSTFIKVIIWVGIFSTIIVFISFITCVCICVPCCGFGTIWSIFSSIVFCKKCKNNQLTGSIPIPGTSNNMYLSVNSPKEIEMENIKPKGLSTLALIALCFGILLVPGVQSCDTVFTLNSLTLNELNLGSGQLQYIPQLSGLALFGNPSQEACYTAYDEYGNPILTLRIKYQGTLATIPLNHDYWTCPTGISGVSYFECPDDGVCQGGFCKNFNNQSDITVGGLLNKGSLAGNEVVKWPGYSYCDQGGYRGDPDVPCGPDITSNGNGCIGNRGSYIPILPETGICSINLFRQPEFYSTFFVNITDAFNKTIFNGTFNTVNSTGVFKNGISIQIQFDLGANLPFTSEDKLMICPSFSKIVKANPVNSLIPGQIGDVQARTSTAFTTPNPFGFNIPPIGNLGNRKITKTKVQYLSTPISGWFNHFNYDALPKQYGNGVWIYDSASGKLISVVTNPKTVAVTFVIDKAFNLTISTNLVCPNLVEAYNFSGCAKCSAGFTGNILAESTCAEGVSSLYTNNANLTVSITTPSVYLTNNKQIFNIQGYTSVENNDFTLVLQSKNKTSTKRVQFKAILVDNIKNETTNSLPGNNTNDKAKYNLPKNPFKILGDFFKGIGGWETKLISLAIIFGSIFLFILIVMLLLWRFAPNLFKSIITAPIRFIRWITRRPANKSNNEDNKELLGYQPVNTNKNVFLTRSK